MRTVRACTTTMQVCVRSWCSHRILSASISTGERRKSASLPRSPEIKQLIDAYRAGDVYHALAVSLRVHGRPDPQHWKKNNTDMRNRMKRLQLAINYGMGVPSLAKGLNSHPLIASGIIEKHRRKYPRFWKWRDEMVHDAMLRREMRSVFGWPLRISTSPNKRTLYNFPMQSNGAEMLRLAAWRMCEAGVIPCMLIHDGLLIEARNTEQVEQAKQIMRDGWT